LLRVRSADGSERGALSVGAFTSYHSLDDLNATSYRLWVSQLQLGYAVSKELELGIAQPLRAWSAHGGTSRPNPTSDIGWGDLEASAKLQLPLPWQRLRLGMLGDASFPTGSGSRGMSSDATDLLLGGLLTLDLTQLQSFVPTRLHANGRLPLEPQRGARRRPGTARQPARRRASGRRRTRPSAAVPIRVSTIRWCTAPASSSRPRVRRCFTEFAWDDFAIPGSEWLDNPAAADAGLAWCISATASISPVRSTSRCRPTRRPPRCPRLPEWRLTLGVTYRSALALGDPDHDGITSKRDSCPERRRGFRRLSGRGRLVRISTTTAMAFPIASIWRRIWPKTRMVSRTKMAGPTWTTTATASKTTRISARTAPEDYDGRRRSRRLSGRTPAITPSPGTSGTPPGSVNPSRIPTLRRRQHRRPRRRLRAPRLRTKPAPNSPPPPPPPPKPGG
jgi:hypothetical protein